MSRYLESIYPDADRAVRLRSAGQDQDRDHEEPPVVQRPDDRPAVRPHGRRLHRAGRGPGQPARHPGAVQLGARADSRGHPRHHLAADRIQHPPLVHRGPGRRERGLPAAPGVEPDAAGARAQTKQALEPRHDQPRLHPAQRARRPPDGLLPGPALRPLHAQAVRRRRLDQDAHGLSPGTDDRPGDRRLLPRRKARLREGLSVLSRRGDQDDPHPRQRGADQVLAARAPAQGEARRSRLERRMAYEHFARRDFKEARPVRRQGAQAQAAPSAGQLRQGPAPGDDRRQTTPPSPSSSRPSTRNSPTSG